MVVCAGVTRAQRSPVILDRDGSTIVLEPYAPNIIRVSLSLNKRSALSKPGYGFVATPAAEPGCTVKLNKETMSTNPLA